MRILIAEDEPMSRETCLHPVKRNVLGCCCLEKEKGAYGRITDADFSG